MACGSSMQSFLFWYVTLIKVTVNPFPNKPWFLHLCSTSLLKTLCEKEKLLVTSNFSFSHSVFYPFGELLAVFINFWNCHLQTLSVWKSLKFVIWERVKQKDCQSTTKLTEYNFLTSPTSKSFDMLCPRVWSPLLWLFHSRMVCHLRCLATAEVNQCPLSFSVPHTSIIYTYITSPYCCYYLSNNLNLNQYKFKYLQTTK